MRLFRRRGEGASTLDLLVAGLGNPGREYERTRHNAGWMVIDELARRHGGSFRSKFDGQLAEVRAGRAAAGAAQAGDVHERFREVDLGGAAVLQGRPGSASGRTRRRRPRVGAAAGAHGRRARGTQRAALDSGDPWHAGLPAVANRRGASGPRRSAAGCGLRAVAVRPEQDVEALVSRAADAVETIAAEGVEPAQQRFN